MTTRSAGPVASAETRANNEARRDGIKATAFGDIDHIK